MKHSLLLGALGLLAFGAAAQEVGNVISSVPVIQQVAVPRTTCAPGVVAAGQPMTSGGGGLLGAVAGGLIGSTIGGGSGQVAAAIVGTMAGAMVGNNIEATNARVQQMGTPHCATETSYENRTVAYNVTYEYAGRQYTVQMPYDPGPTVRLSVTPISQAPAPLTGGMVTAPPVQVVPGPAQVVPAPVQTYPAPVATVPPPLVMAAPIVVQPYAAYPAYPAYPAYAPPAYYRPWYPPVSVSLGFVFGRHHHRHGGFRHRGWR